MTRILVIFHSVGGATFALANAVADGAASVADCTVELRRVPELPCPEALYGRAPLDADPLALVPEARPEDLTLADGFAFGSPVHFGSMSAALRLFLEHTGGLWRRGALIRRPATVFVGAGSGAGREAAILSVWAICAVHGMTLVPVGMRAPELTDLSEANGGSPFGAGSLSGGPGVRPSRAELATARVQGRALAEVAAALAAEPLS